MLNESCIRDVRCAMSIEVHAKYLIEHAEHTEHMSQIFE